VALFELRDVAKHFAAVAGPVTALESATLSVEGGELLDTPSEGKIEVAGHQLTGESRAALFDYRREKTSGSAHVCTTTRMRCREASSSGSRSRAP
jgi:hypothetical protein